MSKPRGGSATKPAKSPSRAASATKAKSKAAPGRNGAGMTYADAGVNIEAGDAMVGMIQRHLRRTYGPRVLGREGGFAGCFRLDFNERLFQRNYRDPVLVACADGVGTKVLMAIEMGIVDTLGQDLVAMNVNDLIVQGAEPLFFLDYIGVHELEPQAMTDIVKGVADGCELAGCALLGGETAEMPDVYKAGDFDLAGFCVGVAELSRVIDGQRAEPGDVLLGLTSSGVHSNGFTLVRKVVKSARLKLSKTYPEAGDAPLGELLLEPTRIYAKSVVAALRAYTRKMPISAMAHITGGGLEGNLPRVLHEKVDAVVDTKNWDVPPLFRFLQERGGIDEAEMWRVFNMGIGYVIAVRPHFADSVARRLKRSGETVVQLGHIRAGSGKLKMK